ncbi:sugar ABC transporter ATP-binding protein [Paenarthrobacter sp. NEAU-H11]|uniref:sugar ABC transporter ATP-binding protein n=1 Tax=Paenarthrobacter sp. NEAU-H11 TaxID=3423924 RepID=UPI003D3540FB
MSAGKLALRVEGASKSFGPTRALRGASFELESGTVHALLGGNGSGKSTLMKALAGVQSADDGTIEIQGRTIGLAAMTPTRAREMGLRFVHQQPSTFANLTVAENLSIGGPGFDVTRTGRIRWRRTRTRARDVLDRFEIAVHPNTEMAELGPATQTMVAIARALQDQEDASDGILLLDEPTASLPDHEVTLLLDALRRYAATGQTIVFVTHRLEEVFTAADRATLLSDGRVVGTVSPRDISHDDLVELIMGRPVEQIKHHRGTATGGVVLDIERLSAGPIEDFSMRAYEGEIVGVTGLMGSGRSSLLKALFGVLGARAGTVRVQGTEVRLTTPLAAMAAGISFVPEDRASDAAFADLTLKENLSIASVGQYWRGGRLRQRSESQAARELLTSFAIKADSIDSPLNSLSGGNQQKAILARWLRRDPKVLLLDEPTQGVDVGARAEIYGHIRRAVNAGSAAIIASSDTEELAAICDRVVVLRKGRQVAEVAGDDLKSEVLQRLSHTDGPAKEAA